MRAASGPRILRADPQRLRTGPVDDVDEPNPAQAPAPDTPSALEAPPVQEHSDMYDPSGALDRSLEDTREFYREVDAADHGANAEDVPFDDDHEAAELFSPDDMDTDVPDHAMSVMVDTLQTLGVDPVCALRFAIAVARPKPSLVEVYGRGSLVDTANARSLSLPQHRRTVCPDSPDIDTGWHIVGLYPQT